MSSTVGIFETSYEAVVASAVELSAPLVDGLVDVGSAQAARGRAAAAARAMRACAFEIVMMCLPMGVGFSPCLLPLCTYMHINAYYA